MMVLEIQLAAIATGLVLGFFQRMLSGTSDRLADQSAERVVSVLERLSHTDAVTRQALSHLRLAPGDPSASVRLQQRIEEVARADERFRAELSRSLSAESGGIRNSTVDGGVMVNGGQGHRISLKNITRKSGALWFLVGVGLVIVLAVGACGGAALAYARDNTTYFDTKTVLHAAGGWQYRVSQARLKTSPQLKDRGPAKPGYRYLYLDITVENLLDDREAPGIQFHFGRRQDAMSEGCGAVNGGFFGPMSSYAEGIVPGWCISRTGGLFTSGASCFETNDSFLHMVDRIPPGGKNNVRCVDSYFVKDDVDLKTLRVYYLGADFWSSRSDVPYLKQIPTKV